MNYITKNLRGVIKDYTIAMVLFDFIIALFVLLTFPFFILIGMFNFIRNNRGN